MNFWKKLYKDRPFFVLAPMANVTDAAFRKMIAKYGKPDVMWTEFVSAEGLMSSGRYRLLPDLKFGEKERPIVAQLFSGNIEAMRGAAKLVAKLGFDGLDINMGCPDRAVEKQGGGAAMMKDQCAAIAVLEAARGGVHECKQIIPVSVKTRLGYNKVDFGWVKLLLQNRSSDGQALPALTVHLRTRKEMSDVPAHWEIVPEIMKMRDSAQSDISAKDRTLIIGNGDVTSLEDAREKVRLTGCDGVMIGRGIFGKPGLFSQKVYKGIRSQKKIVIDPTTEVKTRLKVMLEHAVLFEKMFGKKRKSGRIKNFAVMKKHFKAYVNGFDGAKDLRVKLMEASDIKEVKKLVAEYLSYKD